MHITLTEARKELRVCRRFFLQLVERYNIHKIQTTKKYRTPQYLYSKKDVDALKTKQFRHPHKLHFAKHHLVSTPHWELPGGVEANFTSHVTRHGYREVHYPAHPNANSTGTVPYHQLVMECHLKRYLTKKEVVHHKDGDRLNNYIENLVLYADKSQHLKQGHAIEYKLKALVQRNMGHPKRKATIAKIEAILDAFLETVK